MEKKFNLKVSARISPNTKDAVQAISFNQILLRNKQSESTKKFQLDKIYSHSDQNQKLFENILRVPTNLLIEGLSSVVLCIGSPNSGKTYTLAGKLGYNYEFSEPGIMIYLMRRLFSKFKHEVSLYSTYSFWCKFCFVEHNQVTNLMGSDVLKGQGRDGIIEIKSYSNFEEIISTVYRNNSNKRHTIIELILQKENNFRKVTTSSITFVEFGSFFYNCPYREAEQLSLENDIETVLQAIKNLSRSPENHNQLFGASLLTKTLKQNFLHSTSFELIGILDECDANNLKTLNFLDIVMHQKQDRNLIKNFREEIKREEIYLKNLYEKHSKILNLLSRCIGMELGYLQKQKKSRNFEGPILNTFYKTCEKIKYANIKKLQNEKTIQQIRALIQKQTAEFNEIDQKYEQKMNQLHECQKELKKKKQCLQKKYEEIITPMIKFSNNDNSLFWKLEDVEPAAPNKYYPEEDIQNNPGNQSQRQSKTEGKSLKTFPSPQLMSTHKNVMKLENIGRDRHEKYERNSQKQVERLQKIKLQALKAEAVKMFGLIYEQEVEIEKQAASLPSHEHKLINKIKNRHKGIQINEKLLERCLKEQPKTSMIRKYHETVASNKIHKKFEQKQMALSSEYPSATMFSNKSLKSQMLIKK